MNARINEFGDWLENQQLCEELQPISTVEETEEIIQSKIKSKREEKQEEKRQEAHFTLKDDGEEFYGDDTE